MPLKKILKAKIHTVTLGAIDQTQIAVAAAIQVVQEVVALVAAEAVLAEAEQVAAGKFLSKISLKNSNPLKYKKFRSKDASW